MSVRRLERVRSILAAALQLPLERRAEFVRKECDSDCALLAEVEDLIGLHAQAGEFLNTPVPELLGAKLRTRLTLPARDIVKGRYRIEKLLAESRFATVYLAKDETVAEKLVVIKVLDQIYDEKTIQNAFQSELRSLSQLHHPNVVGVSDIGTLEQGTPFLVLNYVPGVTLRELLRDGIPSVNRTRKIVQGIGQALAAAHKVGVCHLDMKPENVILSDTGTVDERVIVIDFGIAQLKSLPDNALIAGSPPYMAPEQKEAPGTQCDIFSFAVVAFELFSGQLPDRKKPIEKQLPRSVGPRASLAIAKALEIDPLKRFNNVREFMEEVCFEPRTRTWPRYLFVAAGLFVLGVAIIIAYGRMLRNPVYSKPIPFVTSVGNKYRPSFSPDGKWLFYSAGPLDGKDIYKKATSGGEPIKVVDHPADDDQPTVSPDGTTLAFTRIFPSEYAVILKPLDASGTETEIGRAREFSSLSWSADGNSLVVGEFLDRAGGTKLRSVNRRTREWKDLITPSATVLADDNPTVSPSGKQIAFVRKWTQESADLFVLDVDASLKPRGEPTRITNKRERIDSLQWTPDGRDIIYLAGPLGKGSLWRVPSSGGVRSAVLPDLSHFESIAIPRHAWKFAFSIHLSDSNIWRLELGTKEAGNLKRVIAGTYNDEEARLSPDGRMIAFGSARSGEEQIWVARSDGVSPRQISSFSSPDSMSVIWTHDSKDLIVSVRSKELGERIYRTPATGPSAFTELMREANATSLSRDGNWLYVCRRLGNERQIWRTDYPQMKNMERIVAEEARVGIESPDGHSLFFTKRTEKEGVWQQTLPHGPVKLVADRIYRRNLFAPGRNGLFYIASVPGIPEGSALFFRDHNGKITRLHTFNQEVFWGLDLSSDERSLLFSQFDVNNADIMLVEAFQ